MIGDYATTSATWRRAGSINAYGEAVYTDAPVRGRWEGRRSLVRNAQGNEVVSEGRFYTSAPVRTGDALLFEDGSEWPVIAVSDMTTLSGADSHREVAL